MGFYRQIFSLVLLLFLTVLLFVTMGSHPTINAINPRTLRAIFELLIAIVFAGMNLLYLMFWKNNAVNDYFETHPVQKAERPDSPPLEHLEADPEFEPLVEKPHLCPCGFDLQGHMDQLSSSSDEIPFRCPNCERQLTPDDCVFESDESEPEPDQPNTSNSAISP